MEDAPVVVGIIIESDAVVHSAECMEVGLVR